jgi:hypothetical protein
VRGVGDCPPLLVIRNQEGILVAVKILSWPPIEVENSFTGREGDDKQRG